MNTLIVAKNKDVEPKAIKMIEGLPARGDVRMRPLMVGDQMIMLEIEYRKGAASPVHTHQHESVCYIVKGRATIVVGDETYTLGPGDTCRHPEGVSHGIEALEDTIVVEVKSPVQALDQFLGTER